MEVSFVRVDTLQSFFVLAGCYYANFCKLLEMRSPYGTIQYVNSYAYIFKLDVIDKMKDGNCLLCDCLGSAEGFSQANKAINSAIKSGRWVMLKNVHLAPSWLVQLEKKLHRSVYCLLEVNSVE